METSPNGGEPVLVAEKITKRFPGTVALDGVDFTVYAGAVNVLIGENGAGKSTLMKILAGVDRPTSGRLLVRGHPVEFKSTREAAQAGIGIIFQELNLYPNLSISENIFVARELTRNGVVQHRRQEQVTEELLQRLEQPLKPGMLVRDLRMGQQQIVEIAKALSQNVRILIMDEPTSALTSAETEALFQIISDLKADGVAIIYISHKLEELLRIGDYVTVLRDGKLAAAAPARSVTVPWMIEKMVGRNVNAPRHRIWKPKDEDAPVLEVKNLTLPRVGGGFTLENVSLTLRRGEILAIFGLMGAGRTELFECLMGLHPEASGEVLLNGRKLQSETVRDRIELGVMLVPEDRQRLGLVQKLSVAHNITLATLSRLVKWFWLSDKREVTKIEEMIRSLAIKTHSPKQPITALSGGNQQKVVIAKSLLTEPRVLLLDEPTRGIDVGAKAEIFEIMNDLAAKGLAVLFVSSELPEMFTIPDRVIVLSKGKITGEFLHDELTEEALVLAAGARQQTEHPVPAGQST
ncbi:MAG: sugar ABC transporter ATP-binding protein [Verrucomicrobia bacterium]|nr:sugar ABC transporter ATP-binding protein [Verrucomicrobiota bacterium]MBV8280009.1 sugar ABC transporter ATP-binding protein [Verrucomicrobiota bacterium]